MQKSPGDGVAPQYPIESVDNALRLLLLLGERTEEVRLTDVSAERYWTVVSEMEVASLEEYTKTSRESMQRKEFQETMKGYHDLIESGRREIYMLEK